MAHMNRHELMPFLRRQFQDLRRGGWPLLLRKGVSVVECVVAMPLVAAARLLRPLMLIRFGGLPSNRFGHFTGNIEIYLCEREAGRHGHRVLDLFYYVQPVCNNQLKRMWNRALSVSRFARWAARLNGWFPGGTPHRVPWPIHADHDVHGMLAGTRPHLYFTAHEEERGAMALRALGLREEKPFVGIYARDPAYRNTDVSPGDPRKCLHDCRDAEIEACLPAAEVLVRRGYDVVRMGALVERALSAFHPHIIDYATMARSDFMDVFLCARCHFFLSGDSGITRGPIIFRRPVAHINLVILGAVSTHNPEDLLIFKKLWLREEHRLLTMREIFAGGLAGRVGNFQIEAYDRLGIDVLDNTPEEITALAIEMEGRLSGIWRSTEEDEELQRRCWTHYRECLDLWPDCAAHLKHRVLRSRLGTEFLRQQHSWLLEQTLPSAPLIVSLQ